jgi:hypothetical protein
MKRQLSNEFSYLFPLMFSFSGVAVAAIILVIFFTDAPAFEKVLSTLILLIFSFVTGYYPIRLYKVSFDPDYLYFSRFGREQKVSLDKISDVKISVIPWSIFYLTSYPVKITYLDITENRVKKIRFFSRGIFRIVGSIREIPNLDTLKKFIKEKKYGR